jgi:hypothetical protein
LEKVRCCNAVLPICCSISIARAKRMRAWDAHIGVSACQPTNQTFTCTAP